MPRQVKAQKQRNLNLLLLSNKKLNNRLKILVKMYQSENRKVIFSVVFHVFDKNDFFPSILIKYKFIINYYASMMDIIPISQDKFYSRN